MTDQRSLADIAADPNTDPAQLQQLAAAHRELLPIIAKNPAAYQDLLDWMGALGDPEVDAALASSRGSDSGVLDDATVIRKEPDLDDKTITSPVSDDNKSEDATQDDPTWLAPPAEPTVRKSAFPAATSVPASAPPLIPPPTVTPPTPPATADPLAAFPNAQPPAQKSNRGLWITFIVLAILAVIAVAAAIWVFVGAGDDEDEDSDAAQSSEPVPTATVTVTPSETVTPDATPTPTQKEIRFPAPSGSVAATWFASPSGNIACQMSNSQTVCTIFQNDYAYSGYQSCGGSTTFVIKDNVANVDCSAAPVSSSSAPPLLYNTSSSIGDYACLSTSNGMNCWNTVTGASLAFARQGWITGNSGAIPENQYPW